MEVKIGVVDNGRELVVSSADSADDVQAQISKALEGDAGVLALVDDKGRRFLVPSARIAYVEIGASDSRKVGFAVT